MLGSNSTRSGLGGGADHASVLYLLFFKLTLNMDRRSSRFRCLVRARCIKKVNPLLNRYGSGLIKTALLVSSVLVAPHVALAEYNTAIDGNNGTLPLPTGQYVTPQKLTNSVQQLLNPHLPQYPNFVAGMAVRSKLSPDGTTLAIICAGQNSLDASSGTTDAANSTQYIFLYAVGGANKTNPSLLQVLKQTNSWVGLVWAPDGNTLYGTGGADDAVYSYTKGANGFEPSGRIALNHGANTPGAGLGAVVEPNAGGLDISADGSRLVVANNFNDSISVIDTSTRAVLFEHDLRPFQPYNEGTDGAPGGTYPYAVLLKGTGANLVAYVSSDRDREVDVVAIGASPGRLVSRIKLAGNAEGMTFNADQSLLYVAQDNADRVSVINTATNAIVGSIDARAPASTGLGAQTGTATTAVSINNNTLYAVNSGANTIAVIPLGADGLGTVTGLIPTAYEPHDVTFSADGTWMYVINGKSDTGPNPGYGYNYGDPPPFSTITYADGTAAHYAALAANNQYQFQLEHASLVSGAVPTASDLPALTAQAALNNFYPSSNQSTASDAATMAFMRSKIQHVIYIVKENRTFDQLLGDLGNGSNGDPTLTLFGKRITPNFHRLSQQFVTLDNFLDPGDGSMDGWSWSLQGRVTNTETITQQINYAFIDRGLSYDGENANRNVPVQLDIASRNAASNPPGQFAAVASQYAGGQNNLLAGTGDHSATDAPYGKQLGYIFDAVLKAGGTVRNYGFLTNNVGAIGTNANPISDPYNSGVVQVSELNPALVDKTDVYFRGFDQNYPDLWRFNEWNREFQQYVANGQLPTLELVRLAHDHTGNFGTALAGLTSPETQQADNDYSVARLIQAVANSQYAANTLIISIEDDSQDGADHYDSHRSTTYVVGPYVKQGAVVSTRYNQVSALRTIEDILGTEHINLNTAYQRPMADVFDTSSNGAWSFVAQASRVLATTTLQLAERASDVQFAEGPDFGPTHDASYWAHATRGFDFSKEDRVPVALFNEVLWKGIMGETVPYSTGRSGMVLRQNSQ